jgi:hypothetical protein
MTLIEAISVFGTLGLASLGGYISIRIAVAKLETRVTQLEKDIDEEKSNNRENFGKMFEKLDDIKEDISQIKIRIGK